MNCKKIVFASGRPGYVFTYGGSEIGIRDLLMYLNQQGFKCELLGSGRLTSDRIKQLSKFHCHWIKKDDRIEYHPISNNFGKCILFADLSEYENYVIENLKKKKWHALITQFYGAQQAAEICMKYNAKVFLYVQDWDSKLTKENVEYFIKNNLPIIVLSGYLKKQIKKDFNYISTVIYPKIDFSYYRVKNNSRKFITFINPSPLKGFETFKKIAVMKHDWQFLVVDAWSKIIPIPTPKEIIDFFHSKDNIHYMSVQPDMRKIYVQTSVLIVPSIWNEAFGRVVLEAQINGIPVIASNRGGLPEAVGKGGIIIDDFQNPAVWVTAIHKVRNNKKEYYRLSELAQKNAKKFSVEKKDKILLNLL